MEENTVGNTRGRGGGRDSLGLPFARPIEMHRDVPALGRVQQADRLKQRGWITETGINTAGVEDRNDIARFRVGPNRREILRDKPIQDTGYRLFILAAKYIGPDRRARYQTGGAPENGRL